MTRVLVTGARGFVGRPTVDALVARGHEVVAVTSGPPPGERRPSVRWVTHDLLAAAPGDLVSAAGATHLLHLAWYAEHGRFWTSPRNLDWVAASVGLLRAFAEGGGERVVMAGTCAEYAWGAPGPLAEDAPTAPATLYGAAKDGLRVVAEAYARQQGLSLAWGRIFFCFGPGEPPERLVPSVARALLRGEQAPVTHGRQVRDFLAAGELGDAFAGLAASAVAGPVNVASGRPTPVRELVAAVAHEAGRPDLVRYGAIGTRPGDPDAIVADVRRLRDEVGWTPGTSLADGVARAVAWWAERS